MSEQVRAKNAPTLGRLFSTFFKVGAVTFGGGYAMIPIIQAQLVDKEGWVEEDDFIDMIGLTQSAPGPVAVNLSVYVGYRLAGVPGAIAATLGTALPSLLVIMTIAWALASTNLSWLDKIFAGVRPTVVALIAFAAYKLGKKVVNSWQPAVMTAVVAALVIGWKAHPALLIVSGALLGLLWSGNSTKRGAAK